jgi:alpha-L-rhamnosidase
MKTLLILFIAVSCNVFSQHLNVEGLLCEYQTNPLGIDVSIPRLSWKLISARRDLVQTSYELRVSTDPGNSKPLWQSGKVPSDQSVNVPYGGPALQSRQRYYWQVRSWDNDGNCSPWSETNSWEMGLLAPSEWIAKWIRADIKEDSALGPANMLRKTFVLSKTIQSARLYVTCHGLYEVHINGGRVGNDYLTPGWTSYNKRIQYQVYDVTALLKNGNNAIGVTLGDGWYRGLIGFNGNKNFYGDKLALLLQLEVISSDGTRETITSDGSWKSSTGPIRMSEIYLGETYDARLEKPDWNNANFNDTDWSGVKVIHAPNDDLIASYSPPIRKHETFHPLKIFKTPKGETVVDFGQNLVGWVQLKVKGNAGDSVVLKHAEVLDSQGNFYTDNLRSAKQEVKYILKGGNEEVFEPHFTYFGFRYVLVEGYPGELTGESLTAIALYSDLQQTGTFSCSNTLINQLYHNIQWGQKGNFLDIPTDCPQRDERLGWTGDAQVFSRTGALNMNVCTFFTKWLKDLAADQHADGSVPYVIPNCLDTSSAASAGWSDASTIIPWNMYLAYGDKRILEQQYSSMKAWVGYVEGKCRKYLWNSGFHFGDWLFYRPDDDNDGRSAVTDKYLIAQAFFAHSTRLLLQTAQVLGKQEDVKRYSDLLEHVTSAFLNEYVTPNGRLASNTQTAYVLALHFDLLPEALRQQAAERLVENIHDYGNHLTTGFLGTPYLCDVLSRFGYSDVAYTLLLQDTYPSWLYPVKMGATTIWERWDGIKPDGTFQTPGMNSFNHYAYGSIGEWMFRIVAGIDIDPSGPGYKRIRIAPHPGGNLTEAKAELETLYGTIKSSWRLSTGVITVNVTIPANTTAEILLPKAASKVITEENINNTGKSTITSHIKIGDDGKSTLGSGEYHFEYRFEQL